MFIIFKNLKNRWKKWSLPTKISLFFGFIAFLYVVYGISKEIILTIIENPSNSINLSENTIVEKSWQKEFKDLSELLKINNTDTTDIESTSFDILLKLSTMIEENEKYIFDAGKNILHNRISLFINNQDELCFRVIDKKEKNYYLKIPRKDYNFIYDFPTFLICEFVNSKNSSRLEIFAGTVSLKKNDFNHKIDFDFNELKSKNNHLDSNINFKLGSDLLNNNFAAFDTFFFCQTKSLLSQIEKRKIQNIVKHYMKSFRGDNLHYFSFTGDGRRIWK